MAIGSCRKEHGAHLIQPLPAHLREQSLPEAGGHAGLSGCIARCLCLSVGLQIQTCWDCSCWRELELSLWSRTKSRYGISREHKAQLPISDLRSTLRIRSIILSTRQESPSNKSSPHQPSQCPPDIDNQTRTLKKRNRTMAPLVPIFPTPSLPERVQILQTTTYKEKRRKGGPIDLEKCALLEMLQYSCNPPAEGVPEPGVVRCKPVVRLFRRLSPPPSLTFFSIYVYVYLMCM